MYHDIMHKLGVTDECDRRTDGRTNILLAQCRASLRCAAENDVAAPHRVI